MRDRIAVIRSFCFHFLSYLMLVREVLLGLLLMLLLAGFLFSWFEDIRLTHAIYFTFITGLSIGYGDITPETGLGAVVSIIIGVIGMILTGMTIAVATRALADTTRDRIEQKQ